MGGAAWRGLLRVGGRRACCAARREDGPNTGRGGALQGRCAAGTACCRGGDRPAPSWFSSSPPDLYGSKEQAVTVAISCIQTIHADQMPHLLRFLLLAATPVNAGRIISQIREQLKFVGVVDPRAARSKKLKGKASTTSTDGAILHALRSGLWFKNMLCEAFLKELKSVDHPKDHKVIDVWLIMLIYANGGALQKSADKILKSKILQGYIRDTLFNQCICENTELVKDHFMSYLLVSDYLLACKEEKAREFATYLFTALFEEFNDTFSRQELIGSFITHIGSGVSYEVSFALDIMISLTSNHSEELIPIASHITGIGLSHVFCLTSYRTKGQFRELLKKGSLCQPIVQVWKQLTIMGSSEHIN